MECKFQAQVFVSTVTEGWSSIIIISINKIVFLQCRVNWDAIFVYMNTSYPDFGTLRLVTWIVASCDHASISACATCFRLALSLCVTRFRATCPCNMPLRLVAPCDRTFISMWSTKWILWSKWTCHIRHRERYAHFYIEVKTEKIREGLLFIDIYINIT
jgi:hypothetical protein